MKHTLAVAKQVQAAAEQSALAIENNRLLLLICAKLGIDPNPNPSAIVADETILTEPEGEVAPDGNTPDLPAEPESETPPTTPVEPPTEKKLKAGK